MNTVDYLGTLTLALPMAVLAVAMLAVLAVDLRGLRGMDPTLRRMVAAALCTVGCVLAAFMTGAGRGSTAEGAILTADPLSAIVQMALLGLTVLTVGVSTGRDVGHHVGEYYALVLLATIGMLFLVASEHLLMIFVSLEMTSLALYVLVGLHKHNPRSIEAALKYFLYGSVASAFALFGFSLVYGATGALELREIARALQGRPLDPMLAAALVMVGLGFGFKIAAVPFHLWAPDTYQGAPTASAAFIASSSKLAGFVILAKVMLLGFPGLAGSSDWNGWTSGWVPLLSGFAALSMVLGNLAALVQHSVKRLLAYSAIAHAGYTLVGVAADNLPGVVAVVYYGITYAIAALGAFAVAGMVEETNGDARIEGFAGLGRRSPIMAMCLLVFLLSLAGIPPLAGFYGKFALFASAVHAGPGYGQLWLVAIAVVTSAVSLFYYLAVLKQAFVRPPTDGAGPLQPDRILRLAVVLMALAVLALGCMPDLLVARLNLAVTAAGW
jgi:NADH-quinone oxidoreductase subunit N